MTVVLVPNRCERKQCDQVLASIAPVWDERVQVGFAPLVIPANTDQSHLQAQGLDMSGAVAETTTWTPGVLRPSHPIHSAESTAHNLDPRPTSTGGVWDVDGVTGARYSGGCITPGVSLCV